MMRVRSDEATGSRCRRSRVGERMAAPRVEVLSSRYGRKDETGAIFCAGSPSLDPVDTGVARRRNRAYAAAIGRDSRKQGATKSGIGA